MSSARSLIAPHLLISRAETSVFSDYRSPGKRVHGNHSSDSNSSGGNSSDSNSFGSNSFGNDRHPLIDRGISAIF